MTTQTEALKLALEAYLCREMPAGTVIGDPKWWAPKIAAAIKEALEQPEQEPVAQWQKRHPLRTEGVWENTNEHDAKWWRDKAQGWEIRALYTSPPAQRKPLTERELMKCITQAKCFGTVKMTYESGPYEIDRLTLKAFEFARALEAAHEITGETK